ncbi:MAG: sigma-70 family RNA polymerase sigma factor [Thermoanaerobaculia bacterium]
MANRDRSITQLLHLMSEGNREGIDQLFEVLHTTLYRMCKRRLGKLPGRDSFTPTALLHELYLDLAERYPEIDNRHQFFGYAYKAIQSVAVSHIRREKAQIRGGHLRQIELEGVDVPDEREGTEIVEVFEILARVEAQDPKLAEIIRLRVFDGRSERESAELLGISRRQLRSQWEIGRRLLAHLLGTDRRKDDASV